MPRIVRAALVQSAVGDLARLPMLPMRDALVDRHVSLIERASGGGASVVCLQELFNGPYFCAEQDARWGDLAEEIPGGPTFTRLRDLARRLGIAIVAPIMERAMAGVFYNSAGVIDASGRFLGVARKNHLPHCHPGFWEKFHFAPGNTGYPVFDLGIARVGLLICYDRHFPEAARELGLAGAEIVFNPSATVAGLSEYLWTIEQPAHAVANQFFVGAINRVGMEEPWNVGEFYGSSYFCDPRGRVVARSPRDREDVLIADLDLDQIEEVRRVWAWFRDRRPETYRRTASVLASPEAPGGGGRS